MNGVDVSGCSHDEAVEVLTRASEPIMVQVKHRQSSDAESPEAGARSSSAETPGSQCSREIQTETDVICDHCGEFYGSYTNYNCDIQLEPALGDLGDLGDSLIYPELQYEVSTGNLQ